MRGRWLLLAVSVVCLLVLAPASALSQRPELHATCGSANVDGVMSPGEWDHAGVAEMMPLPAGAAIDTMLADLGLEGSERDTSLAAPATVTARMYAMNDGRHLYLAQLMNLDSLVADPLYWNGWDFLRFLDEDTLEGVPEAETCGPPRPGEGEYMIFAVQEGSFYLELERLTPWAQSGICTELPDIPGVTWAMGPGSLVVEWDIDLSASDVDKVGPGDCFLIWKFLQGVFCPQGTADCTEESNWVGGQAEWPPQVDEPITWGMLCLDPCEAEFVPELGSMMLLGSGLMGLATYAALRWRARE